MPIKDLTETTRLPRLGKIHLGTKHPEKGYPMKADHFIFPKDHPDYGKLVELFGEEAKELRIMIPVEDEETWGSQYYKCYNMTYGLVCKGDGELATRMVDIKTQELPDAKKTQTTTMKEMPCLGKACPEYKAKKCHEVMNFRFIIPEVPGLGVWQIDTGSINSILNLNSCARLIKRAFGRLSMIPLKLTFEPIQVNNPETGKKQTVYTLNLRTDVTMAQLASVAREQVKMLTIGDMEGAFELEVEKDIEDLWGKVEMKEEVEVVEPRPGPSSETVTPSRKPVKAEDKVEQPTEAKETTEQARDVTKLKTIEQLAKVLKEDFGLSYQEMFNALGIENWNYLSDTPAEAYLKVAKSR